MSVFHLKNQAFVGDAGTLPVSQNDEVTRRLAMLLEGECELGLSIQTVHSHYSRAFALLVGHGYSPELWHRLFGVLKRSELIGAELGAVSQARPLKSRTRRSVPETSVCTTSADGHPQGVVCGATAPGAGQGPWGLLEDIRTLLPVA